MFVLYSVLSGTNKHFRNEIIKKKQGGKIEENAHYSSYTPSVEPSMCLKPTRKKKDMMLLHFFASKYDPAQTGGKKKKNPPARKKFTLEE